MAWKTGLHFLGPGQSGLLVVIKWPGLLVTWVLSWIMAHPILNSGRSSSS